MRLVSAMIRPECVEAVTGALDRLGVMGGMTVTDVRGFGRQRGQVEHYRGGEYRARFVSKVRVDIAVRGRDVEAVLETMSHAARTGHVGDGKIVVAELLHAIRIRTGERGAGVL